MEWYLAALRKYADFGGRARRKEYWMFTLINSLFLLAPYALLMLIMTLWPGWTPGMLGPILALVIAAYWLGIFLPSMAVATRRLHDTGRSGWWFCINLVPLLGGIAFLVFLCQDTAAGDNQYGANPKQPVW